MGKKTFDAQKATEKFFSPCGEQVASLREASRAPKLSNQATPTPASQNSDDTSNKYPCGEQVAPLRGASRAPESSKQTSSAPASQNLDDTHYTSNTPLRGASCAPDLSKQTTPTHATRDFENTSNTHSTHYTHDTHSTSNTHNTHRTQNSRGYRYNLNLDADLKDFLHETAWKKRMSMTQYINNLIRREMEKDKLKNDK